MQFIFWQKMGGFDTPKRGLSFRSGSRAQGPGALSTIAIMAEFEVKYAVEGAPDSWSQRAGLLSAGLAVVVCFASFLGQHARSEANALKSAANDNWSFYLTKR